MDLINLEEIWNSPVSLLSRVKASEEFNTGEVYKNLEFCWYVFEENYKELREEIGSAVTFSDKEAFDLTFKKVSRLLNNFLAAALMLKDVTRTFKMYESQEFQNEYQKEIDSRFAQNHLNLFVEDLRNYSLHYRLPIAGFKMELQPNAQTGNLFLEEAFFYLDKKKLEEWRNWQKGKRFLVEANEQIKIIDLIDAYFVSIIEFHWWLLKYFSEIHREELNRLSLVNSRIAELMKL